ncbi:sugar phosphate isomerase/epimerase family protein [Erwinia sorbitola]|uniref:Sugar phosphate isomerase/epimerase n=1 Tax=Erwinia sorbitola TaxID=2681984 RepID=A0A6I6ENI8_9GAMM|nr:sugar phosphate isomerase/epimerase [Erwinia sorbitola]MTD28015.1 sugar phosphate isomerase/epimerase [Erwinia sorbitola]QGU85713.1 sugar phosphate isomerase/epimerase [Erwinia sorbitola]
MKREVIVVTAAYGQKQVAAMGGQQALLPIIAAAGADGVELRRELFSEQQLTALPALAQAIRDARLVAFYSVPEALFMEDGSLNPRLDQHFAEAEQLNAQLLKYSLGHYQPAFECDELRKKLAGKKVHLVVENDQTDCGKLSALDRFFHACGESRTCNGMTFDMGNWLWVGDRPLEAARHLSNYVSYIHVKAAVPHGDGWRAVALDEADNLWRETLALLPSDVPRAIEFPLEGPDLVAVTRHYVDLLREEKL